MRATSHAFIDGVRPREGHTGSQPLLEMNMTHVILEGSERVALPGARAIGRANPHTEIEVTLKLRRRAPLPELPERPQQTISRSDFAEKYGASPADIDAVKAAFAGF